VTTRRHLQHSTLLGNFQYEEEPGSKEGQVNGFVNMVMRRIKKGCSVCHVVFIFQHNTPIGLMKRTLNKVYRAILTRYDRDPRKSDNAEKPWFFFGQMYQDERQKNTL
jgi:hypothetical protein